MITGAEIFIESLKREGVKSVFGLPGGVVLKIFDVLHGEKELELILVRHEQAAIHMAEGYARATGRAGVALVTSGPGATNTVTGLVNAWMDSCPIVVITGQVSTSMIGNDAFQEADIVGISRSCTKYNFLVKDVADLARTIKEAFYIATTGRPGPVLVDLPKDVSMAKTDFVYPESVYIRGYNPTYKGNRWQIKQAAEAILKAKKPILYIGGGVINSNGAEEVRELAELTQVPVTMTLMGLGGFPGTHPLSLGMLGMHGSYATNMAVHHCDLLIAVGSRFDDRVTGKIDAFVPHAKIIHIDIDPTSIRKNIHVDIPIVGDVKHVLRDLNELLRTRANGDLKDLRKPWIDQIEHWRREHPLAYAPSDRIIKPQFVIEKVSELTRGDAVIATDVGQHQMWTAQFYKFIRPRTFLNSGGLGTMGYGFPAAIGAQKAFPDRLVVAIVGDGSFQMNLQELATAAAYQLPVKVIIINNRYHGMVRQWQQAFYGGRYSCSRLDHSPDYVKLAEAYGLKGLRASRPDEVEPVLREAFDDRQPMIIDMIVDSYENCYPMVPAGGAINEMILGDPAPDQVQPSRETDKESALPA
ncbi:MAG TPA: biosynthetic-type acetolactate synthase large subunit [Nitrospiria bacterium]|nr:biosynthetic-type acetolactate synthase large subunit [Nitrospiria bacterium]